jgi:hypothetical protein
MDIDLNPAAPYRPCPTFIPHSLLDRSNDAEMDSPIVFPMETASQGTPHVARSTASFHLMHMISTILLSNGFQGAQSGAMAEIERLLELRESRRCRSQRAHRGPDR